MKTILFLLIVCITFISCGNITYSPNKKIDPDQFKEILSAIIKSDHFDNSGYCLWKPDSNDVSNFPLSEDGFCHTTIDSIMYFQNREKVDYAVVILRSYQFDKNGVKFGSHFIGSPVGVGIYKFKSGAWYLDNYKSYLVTIGYYVGAETKYKGTICLKKLPSGLMSLYFRQNQACQMNHCQGFECAYSLEETLENGTEVIKLTEVYYNYFPITSIQSSFTK